MRFKAKLAPEQVSLLYSLVGSMAKLLGGETKNSTRGAGAMLMGGSVLRLDSNTVRLTTKGKGDADGVSFFCELATTDGIFMDHRIQSASDDDAIAMEIDLVQMRMALQSIVANNENNAFKNGGDEVVPLQFSTTILKLAKRDKIPCLCLDASTRDGIVAVHHSIPVRIMRVEDANHHLPPRVSTPDVQLELSAERPLRIIAERLKSICPHVFLEASITGELTLRTYNEATSIRAFLDKLTPRRDDSLEGGKDTCCLKMDTKKLVTCLQWQQSSMTANISNALMCFIENEMLIIHITLDPEKLGFLTYYVPVHFLSEEEMLDE